MSTLRHALFSVAVLAAIGIGGAGVQEAPKLMATHAAVPSSDVEIMLPGGAGLGSGVYIGNGIVITAGHVVDDINQAAQQNNVPPVADVIVDQNGVQGAHVNAKVYWRSDTTDLGAIQLQAPVDITPAKIANRDAEIGENIEVVGNPLGISFVHTWGKVGGVARHAGDDDTVKWNDAVPVDVQIAPGNSGSPVYDSNGEVLGIAVGCQYEGPAKVDIMIEAKDVLAQMPPVGAQAKVSIPS